MRPTSSWCIKVSLKNSCVKKADVDLVCTAGGAEASAKYIQAFQRSVLARSAKQPLLVMALCSAVDLN